MTPRPARLGRDFGLLWFGESTSAVGTAVSAIALPLVAISYLQASTWAARGGERGWHRRRHGHHAGVRRLGTARALLLSQLCTAPFALLMPMADAGPALALFVAGYGVVIAGVVSGNIVVVGFRQRYCPTHLLGRSPPPPGS